MPAFKNHNGAYGIPGVIKTMTPVCNFERNLPIFEESNYRSLGLLETARATHWQTAMSIYSTPLSVRRCHRGSAAAQRMK